MIGDVQEKAKATYNAAADSYDASPLSFWNYFGRRTIERLSLDPGSKVLDVCCGAGASAIPAATAAGSNGNVVGIDLAEELLGLAERKAKAAGLTNISFRRGDLLALGFPDNTFDAVVCVFGIFFVPDMTAGVKQLWRLVKPGGKLAITTWEKNLFEPANKIFWDAVAVIQPSLHKAFNPWDRIDNATDLRALLRQAGVNDPVIEGENLMHPLRAPEDVWTIAMGSGYRGTIEQLTPTEQTRLRELTLAGVRRDNISQVETNVLYATAIKAAD